MDVLSYDKSRDLELYIEGEIEAIQQSKPGIIIDNHMLKKIRINYENMINSNEMAGFTAIKNSEPVGFVVVSKEYFMDTAFGFVRNVYICKKSRDKNLWRIWNSLSNHMEIFFRNQGIKSIACEIYNCNDVTLKLTQHKGYTVERYYLRKNI